MERTMGNFDRARRGIVEAAQELSRKGYLMATGGNLSMRIPGREAFAVTPSDFDYERMTPGDVSVLDFDLRALEGDRKPSVESAMHAGIYMARGDVNAVVVGADRIAANGDVANKIGTYTVAVLAKENGVPFYVAAPVSTIDLSTPSGDQIPIEERSPDEVTHHGGRRLAPEGVSVRNPAFDITPARYVTAIVCERGVARPPFSDSLRRLAGPPPT
jgi:hypothetical protein